MDITNFTRVRVGSSCPACFDVSLIDGHESYGVYAQVPFLHEGQRVELRKNSHGDVALFNFKFDDLKLPELWRDSEILWQNKI
jgi:hypothetical protein